ncbi:hypothetical protein [Anaeromyxobacter paludicola]|nr:hypothetical protein [Anaeromyxobacter paludicola]
MDGAPKRLSRRLVLELLAAAPVAAGCALAGRQPPGEAEPRPGRAAPAAPAQDPLRAIRDQPLPADAEPAFVFRAVAPAESP